MWMIWRRPACVLMEHYDGMEHVNIGTGEDISIRELAEIICEVVGYRGELKFNTDMPDGTPRKLLDVSRLHDMGWRHTTELTEGIRRSYQFLSGNTGWQGVDMLPNFICPGAQKSATTTLYEILKQHPDIYLPYKKELRFFSGDYWDRGIDWYEQQYEDYDGEKIVGDISPNYMRKQKIAERIYTTLGPDIKLLFMLRNPADRGVLSLPDERQTAESR